MQNRYKDFDAFFNENEGIKLTFKMFDTTYFMPSSMPAKLMMEILRGQKENNLDGQVVISICESLLGKKQLDDLCNKGFTVDQMEKIIEWASEQYGQKKEDQPENFTLKKLEKV
jgi:hypothetical protein